MKLSASSGSRSIEWSEPIVVVGKGVPNWSDTYGCLIRCIAGLGETSGWLRLYPVFVRPIFKIITLVNNFDVIRTVFRKEPPESKPRAESRKICPEKIVKLGRLEKSQRARLLIGKTEKGSFLHDDSWMGRKTLGLIRPNIDRLFIDDDNFPMVKYRCDSRRCGGHTGQLFEFVKTDDMGRTHPQKQVPKEQIRNVLKGLAKDDLRFVMGTHSKYRFRWIIIGVHHVNG